MPVEATAAGVGPEPGFGHEVYVPAGRLDADSARIYFATSASISKSVSVIFREASTSR